MLKRLVPFCLSIFILFAIINEQRNYQNEVLLKNSHLLSSIKLQSKDLLKHMIILPKDTLNEKEVLEIIETLDQLPHPILEAAYNKNIKIVLFQGRLTDQKEVSHLKGKTPRGYHDSIVWDDVPGIGGGKKVFVKIGSSDKGKGHGSVKLEYHELAHSLYNHVFNDKQTKEVIHILWQQEAPILFPGQRYFIDYQEEYFAECFALFFSSQETREVLKKKVPKTYQFFLSIIK